MIDWFASPTPEQLSAYAVTLAAAIAAASLWAQARSQARQARLALLDRRLRVYEAYHDLLNACVAWAGVMGTSDDDEGLGEKVPLETQRVNALTPTAYMLFEDEVWQIAFKLTALARDLRKKVTEVRYKGRNAVIESDLKRLREQATSTAGVIIVGFEPYVARERRAGLGYWTRFIRFWKRMKEENDRELERSGLGPPQSPLNEQRPRE